MGTGITTITIVNLLEIGSVKKTSSTRQGISHTTLIVFVSFF